MSKRDKLLDKTKAPKSKKKKKKTKKKNLDLEYKGPDDPLLDEDWILELEDTEWLED